MKKRHHSSGFTLFEILIAIFIFSIIVTTIFASFTSVFSNAEAIQADMEAYEMAKDCLNRMILDLREVYVSNPPEYTYPTPNSPPSPYRVIGDTSYAGSQTFQRFRFTSFAHVALEKSTQDGIAEVVYYVQQAGENDEGEPLYVLRRADSLYPYKRFDGNTFEEKTSDPVLCERVKSLTFKYYDDEENEFDRWDSEKEEFKYATPRGVLIKLEIGDEFTSLLFETMVDFPIHREKKE